MSCIDNGSLYTVVIDLMRGNAVVHRLVQEVRFHLPGAYINDIGLPRC
jgi:hypothetical protein